MQEPKGKGKTRAARPIVRGGKALARLQFFEIQRGIGPSSPPQTARGSGTASAAPAAQAPASAGGQDREGRPGATSSPYEATMRASYESRRSMAAAAASHPLAMSPAGGPPPNPPAQWRSIGPFNIPNGQTYGTGPGSRVAVSGRVSAIAVDPSNPRHVLVGAAAGGIWETFDDGAAWAPRTDDMPSLAIGAIAFDPQDSHIVYAGTGEGNAFFHLGAGVIKSTDGGTTWQVIATDPLRGKGFFDLKIDPLNRQHLLAALMGYQTTGGLYESRDGGVTWSVKRGGRAWSVSIRPAAAGAQPGAQEIFVAGYDGLFVSHDTGINWTQVNLPGAPANISRMAVAHAPSNGDVVYVWAAADPNIPDPKDPRTAMPTPYLWRRSTAAGSFATIKRPPLSRTSQAWYDWYLAVAPNDPNVVYVSDLELHRGEKVGATWKWTELSDKTNGDSIHPDQHCIAFGTGDPNVVYAGSDGGLFRSPDRGQRWIPLNPGLCIAEFEFIVQHPQTTDWILGGVQDNGTLRYEGGPVWTHVADGDGGGCGINNSQPDTCFHTFYAMGMERSTTGGAVNSWTDLGQQMNVAQADDYPDGALFYPPVAVKDNFVAQGGITVYMSANNGDTWNTCALPAAVGKSSAIAVDSPTRVYAGTESGSIVRLDWNGAHWGAATLAQPRNGYVSDLKIDPGDPQKLWAAYSTMGGDHVYRSSDGGVTWQSVSAGLPANVPANVVAIDPAHSDRVYAGLDSGVYRSLDGGATWVGCSAGLPNALVKDLGFHQPSRRLRAATESRGVWEIEVDLVP